MPRYEITSPDGKRYEVTAPEGASQEEVLAYAKKSFAQVSSQADRVGGKPLIDPTSGGALKEAAGFVPAFVEGQVRGLGGMLGSIGGGALAVPEAAGRLLMGQGLDKAISEGVKTIQSGAEWGRAPKIPYTNIGVPSDDIFGGARATEEHVGELISKGIGKLGEGAENYVPDILGEKAKAFVRTGTEAVANAGLLGAGAVLPLASRAKATRTAQETARVNETQSIQEAKAREEARRAMGNDEFQGRQGGELEYTKADPGAYDPTYSVPKTQAAKTIEEGRVGDLPQGKRVDLDKAERDPNAPGVEQGTKPGMRVGPLATDPLKREADLTATPAPAERLPSDMVGTGRDRTAYQWRYPDEQQRSTPYDPFTDPQGALDLQRRTAPPFTILPQSKLLGHVSKH